MRIHVEFPRGVVNSKVIRTRELYNKLFDLLYFDGIDAVFSARFDHSHTVVQVGASGP